MSHSFLVQLVVGHTIQIKIVVVKGFPLISHSPRKGLRKNSAGLQAVWLALIHRYHLFKKNCLITFLEMVLYIVVDLEDLVHWCIEENLVYFRSRNVTVRDGKQSKTISLMKWTWITSQNLKTRFRSWKTLNSR